MFKKHFFILAAGKVLISAECFPMNIQTYTQAQASPL